MDYNNGTGESFKTIEGPNLLVAYHWNARHVSSAIQPMLSEATTLESLVLTEVKPVKDRNSNISRPVLFRNSYNKPVWRIFVREQSDHYWLSEHYYTEEAAMIARKQIKDGPQGDSFMVLVHSPYGDVLTES